MLDNVSDEIYQELLHILDLKYFLIQRKFYFKDIIQIAGNCLSFSEATKHGYNINYYSEEYEYQTLHLEPNTFTERVLTILKNNKIDTINCVHYYLRNQDSILENHFVFKKEIDRFYFKLLKS